MEKYIINRYTLIFLLLLFPSLLFASPPSSTYTYTAGQTIQPSEVQQNETNLYNYLSTGVDTYADSSIITDDVLDGTLVNADISGSAAIAYGKLSLGSSILTGDIKDGEITNVDISSTAAISSSKISGGVVLPTGAVFFMVTGSCPSGTTDVSTTYSNKFLRVNATAGSTGGADTFTLAEANLPSHTHAVGTLTVADESAHTHSVVQLLTSPYTSAGPEFAVYAQSGGTTGAGSAHTHSLSGSTAAVGSDTAVSNVPAYLTAKMCQVD